MADLGISVAKEQGLNDGSGLVPADLLVSTWAQGKPCAIDVSIVVSAELTTRGGSSIRSAEDDRAASKMHKYKGLCTTKQWNYQPFVADVYGALSSQARTLLSHYMDSKLNPIVKANPGVCSEVWSGVSGAIVARAGRQWHIMQSMILLRCYLSTVWIGQSARSFWLAIGWRRTLLAKMFRTARQLSWFTA